MKRLGITLFALAVMLAGFTAAPAAADEEQDNTYVFGTTLVLHSPRQLADPAKAWWGDLLPTAYRYSIGSIVDAVNAARMARGETVMVDVSTYPINIGGEFSSNGGWEYRIDFQKMYPADVEVVLTQFPMTGIFADLKRELRPVRIGYFWGNDPEGEQVTIALPGMDFVVNPEEGFSLIKERLAELLSAQFGGRARFDLGLNRYSAAMGHESLDVNITIYLDGAESDVNYGYEGHEHDI